MGNLIMEEMKKRSELQTKCRIAFISIMVCLLMALIVPYTSLEERIASAFVAIVYMPIALVIANKLIKTMPAKKVEKIHNFISKVICICGSTAIVFNVAAAFYQLIT